MIRTDRNPTRPELLALIRSAIRPVEPVTRIYQEQTIEALIAVAATTFLARHKVPFSREAIEAASAAAQAGLDGWLANEGGRN